MRVNIVNKKELGNKSPLAVVNDLETKDQGIETNLLKLAEKYMHSQKRHRSKQRKDRGKESKGGQVKIMENKFGYAQDESAQVRSEIESLQQIERLGSSQHFVFDQPQTMNMTGASTTPAIANRS